MINYVVLNSISDFNRSDRENDTKKDDGYIDWAVYIGKLPKLYRISITFRIFKNF